MIQFRQAPTCGLNPQHHRSLQECLSGEHYQMQQGSAMLQWCIAALPLLLLGSLIIEASNWHATRQRLALTLQRAAYGASMESGTSQALKKHIQANLPSDLDMPIRTCITDPVRALMADFQDHRLSEQVGAPVIRHNHVQAQYEAALAKGRTGGRGSRSGKTIFDANTIHVRLTADYKPSSRWIRAVVNVVPIKVEYRAIMQSHRKSPSPPCISIN